MFLGNREIPSLEYLADGPAFVEQITSMVTVTSIFSQFSAAEIEILVGFVKIYRVQPGVPFIIEGDRGNFMALVLDGKVQIRKQHPDGKHKTIATVGHGKTLGEMAMVDDQPRFATCLGITPVTFGVLNRDDFIQISREYPNMGSKILWQMVMLLNARVRQLSTKLLEYL